MEWIPIDDNCWSECGRKGGMCSTCMKYVSNADNAYCCSGINHEDGDGAKLNGDCPLEAIAVQKSSVHSCVVSKKKGTF